MRSLLPLLAAALLAAGCLQALPPPDEAADPPTRQASRDGLHLSGAASRAAIAPGGRVELSYAARNDGADAVTRGLCERPYAFSLRSANGTVHLLEPLRVACAGFTEDPFPGGASMAFNASWDGTYAEGDRLVPAPPGMYVFIATFKAWRGEQPAAVAVELPIRVLPA